MNKPTERVLHDGDSVSFAPFDVDYGLAEFGLCPVWENGYLHTLYIYPLQQRGTPHYYRVNAAPSTHSFSVQSWHHKGIQEPRIWLQAWCTEHACLSSRLYVPANSNCFVVHLFSSLAIYFDHKSDLKHAL